MTLLCIPIALSLGHPLITLAGLPSTVGFASLAQLSSRKPGKFLLFPIQLHL